MPYDRTDQNRHRSSPARLVSRLLTAVNPHVVQGSSIQAHCWFHHPDMPGQRTDGHPARAYCWKISREQGSRTYVHSGFQAMGDTADLSLALQLLFPTTAVDSSYGIDGPTRVGEMEVECNVLLRSSRYVTFHRRGDMLFLQVAPGTLSFEKFKAHLCWASREPVT